jgi:hypothetical protein
MFDSVHILRHPGYNLGHWGLPHREIEARDGDILVDGLPLAFVHFSGLDLENLDRISQHQDRFSLDDFPPLRRVFEDYRDRVRAAGYAETREWPYAFGRFDNGVPIPDVVRRLYWELGNAVAQFADPFETAPSRSFWN